jgi:hypothetical protein
MNYFEYEISGIANVNRIFPMIGNCYYSYLTNGNILIHGRHSDTDSFCPKKFAQKVKINGGNIQTINKLLNEKKSKMEKNGNKNLDVSSEKLSGDGAIAGSSFETLESEINELGTLESEIENMMAFTGIVLASKSSITTGNATFEADLANFLQNKTTGRIPAEVKQKLCEIEKSLISGEILASNYTSSTCVPLFANASGTSTITINSDAYKPGNLEVTIASKIKLSSSNDAICSIKQNYPMGVDAYSSKDIIKALSEFSAGRTFLKGLTTSTETFTPGQ